MAKEPDSKEKTIIAAARLLRRQGYHGTALNDILDTGGSPRGSLYFHFPKGKEEIGEAALTFAATAVGHAIAAAADTSENAEVFLLRIVRGMASELERSAFTEGCPVATTALETSAQSPVLGAAARRAFETWEGQIQRGLERFGWTGRNAAEAAAMVLAQIEGALLLARTYHSIEPLRRAEKAVVLLAGSFNHKQV